MDLYSELILDLYNHPLHKKKLAKFDLHNTEHNPLCGDTVEIFIKYDKSGTVTDIGWSGDGCAISQASASITTDYLVGKKKTKIKKIKPATILEMLGLEKLNPVRLRCALLALECLKKI